MSNEVPEGASGQVPKNRTPHYLALVAVVAVLLVIFLALR